MDDYLDSQPSVAAVDSGELSDRSFGCLAVEQKDAGIRNLVFSKTLSAMPARLFLCWQQFAFQRLSYIVWTRASLKELGCRLKKPNAPLVILRYSPHRICSLCHRSFSGLEAALRRTIMQKCSMREAALRRTIMRIMAGCRLPGSCNSRVLSFL